MLLLAIAITIVCFLLYSSLERDASGNFRGFTALDISLSIGAGIVTSAVCFFVDMIQRGNGIPMLLQYLPVVLLIIMIGMMVGLIIIWQRYTPGIIAAILAAFLLAVFGWLAIESAKLTIRLIPWAFAASLVVILARVARILAIAFVFIDWLYYRFTRSGRRRWRTIAWISKVIACVLSVVVIANTIVLPPLPRTNPFRGWLSGWQQQRGSNGLTAPDGSSETASQSQEDYVEPETTVVETEQPTTVVATDASTEPENVDKYDWLLFYNSALQFDDNKDNNLHFGENPLADGLSAEDYYAIMRERLWTDPALGAGDMAWFDSITNTRYLGEFFETCRGDWMNTINLSRDTWLEDKELYHTTLTAWWKFINNQLIELRIETRESGLEDQMYMNPYTVPRHMGDYVVDVPDVIVMKTPDLAGTFLVFVLKLKGGVIKEVAYRIDCGFQPTNVQKIMNVTPLEEPPEPYIPVVREEEPSSLPKVTVPETEPEGPKVVETDPNGPKKKKVKETEPSEPETTRPQETTTQPPETTKSRETEPPPPETTKAKPTEPPETDPPVPETKKAKEPAKAPTDAQVPNDDKGPDKDTNTGVGSGKSSAELPGNSGNIADESGNKGGKDTSYDDFKAEEEKVKEAQPKETAPPAPETEAPKKETEAPKKETEAPETTKVDNHKEEADLPATDAVIDAPADGSSLTTNEGGDGAWGLAPPD